MKHHRKSGKSAVSLVSPGSSTLRNYMLNQDVSAINPSEAVKDNAPQLGYRSTSVQSWFGASL